MKTETKTSRKEQLRLIRGLFDALKEACPARMVNDDWRTLYDTISEGEKRHRRGTPLGCENRLGLGDAIKLFCVEYICWARLGKVPDPKDFNHIRREVYIAYGLYCDNQERIDAVLTEEQAKQFTEKVDYAALMNETLNEHQ